MNQSQQLEIPIQPVDQPILCSPYQEPDRHWIYDTSTGETVKNPGRREAGHMNRARSFPICLETVKALHAHYILIAECWLQRRVVILRLTSETVILVSWVSRNM